MPRPRPPKPTKPRPAPEPVVSAPVEPTEREGPAWWRQRPPKSVLVLALLLCVLVVVVVWRSADAMARTAPAWWRVIDGENQATIERADALQNAVGEHVTRRRPTSSELVSWAPGQAWRSEAWPVTMRSEDANAWLNVHLPRWLEARYPRFRWPDEMRDLQVQFDAPDVHIGARVETGSGWRYLSATLTPELREDGSLWVRADWVRVGRLPIPGGWVLGRAEAGMDSLLPGEIGELPDARLFFDVLRGREPVAERPILRLPDDRRVRLLGLRAATGWVELTCQTEHGPAD